MTTTTLQSVSALELISAVLNLRGQEEEWFGLNRIWSFTCLIPGPARGCTFYVPVGSSLETVEARWNEKQAAFTPLAQAA